MTTTYPTEAQIITEAAHEAETEMMADTLNLPVGQFAWDPATKSLSAEVSSLDPYTATALSLDGALAVDGATRSIRFVVVEVKRADGDLLWWGLRPAHSRDTAIVASLTIWND